MNTLLRPALLTACLMLAACDQQEKAMPTGSSPTDLYLHYTTSAESNYTDIKVEGKQLTYTYFNDGDNRCAQWFKSEPCWTKADLKTRTITLTPEEQANLQAALDKGGLLAIQGDDFGEADRRKRAYREQLEVHRNGKERKLTYRSRPDAEPKPAGFQEVETLMREYADRQ